jgi:hypothetical protein
MPHLSDRVSRDGGRGHPMGSFVERCCALARPYVIRSLVLTKNFESNVIPSQSERTGSVRTVVRMDSGRRAYKEVLTARPERTCPLALVLLATALVARRSTCQEKSQPRKSCKSSSISKDAVGRVGTADRCVRIWVRLDEDRNFGRVRWGARVIRAAQFTALIAPYAV